MVIAREPSVVKAALGLSVALVTENVPDFRRLEADVHGFRVPHLADQDHVRGLSQNVLPIFRFWFRCSYYLTASPVVVLLQSS